MKLKKCLIPILMLILVGCGQSPTSSGNPSSSSKSSSASSASYEHLTTTEIREGGSYGGYFIEIGSGRSLAVNERYEFSFDSEFTAVPTFTVTMSHENVATVDIPQGSTKKFYVDTHEVGDCIMCVYNANEMLCFREVIHIRPKYDETKIMEAAYNNDIYKTAEEYKSFIGDYRLQISEYTPTILGVLSGGDDYESDLTINFSLTYDSYQADRDCFLFKATTIDTTSSTTLFGILITSTADTIYVYENYGVNEDMLLTIVVASID